MKILSLDTASARCAVAVVVSGWCRASVSEPMERGQAERLMPMAEEVLRGQHLTWRDLDAIAVGIGPGNFTGIRIAVSAARGLALSLGIPAIGVSAFDALAYGHTGPLVVGLDARQERFYLQGFGAASFSPRLVEATQLSSISVPPETVVLGHQSEMLAGIFGAMAGSGETDSPPENLAFVAAGRRPPHALPAPLYLRAPDAARPADPPPVILDDP